jgi:hypothetical protein
MKRVAFVLLATVLLALGSALDSENSQPSHPLARHWTETKTETLWTTRYTNCDYGFYVLLGSGVVAHATHPPNPNHGFSVSLPDVGMTSSASADEERFVWVDASYDTSDDQSLPAAISEDEQITKKASGQSHTDSRKPARLAGLLAIQSTVESMTAKGAAVDERVVAVRSGIVYTISLHTTQQYQSVDEKQFKKILSGFRLLKLPRGECSNG